MSDRALRFGHQAEEDLIEIWNYVGQHDIRAADRLLDDLEARLQLLARYPLAGPVREDMPAGIRHLVIDDYLAFYRLSDDAVEVIRILHGRRNITAEDIR
jgi:toxin ParE1/3/4